MATKFAYSAAKDEDGRFTGSVYAATGEATFPQDIIANFEGLRSVRRVKAFTKAAAQKYNEDNRAKPEHNEYHSVSGSLEL